MMAETIESLTLSDFEAAGWREIMEAASGKTCLNYGELFQPKFVEAEKIGNAVRARVYRLLMEVSYLRLEPHSVEQPYQARFRLGNGRSATPEDFAPCDVALFNDLAQSVKDPEMRARLADLSWILTRQHGAAELAINSYLESAKQLEDPKLPVECLHRLERALRLAAQLRSDDLIVKVTGHIQSILATRRSEFPFRLACGLLDMLSESHRGDPAKCAAFADEYATHAESQNDFETAHDFWRLKAKWLGSPASQGERRLAQVAAADTHVKKADLLIRSGMQADHMTIADLLERSIQAHRQIPNQKERVAELHKRLLSIQLGALDQLKTMELARVNVTDIVERAISRVRGKDLPLALLGIASIVQRPEPETLRKQAIENFKFAPLTAGLPRVIVGPSGKIVAKTPSAFSSDEAQREASIKHAMKFELDLWRNLSANAIAAARSQIVLEHPVSQRDWDPLITDNPFIPPGRERIFAEGLHAGLMGNLLVAVHLLVPQFENSIREILTRGGAITSKLNNEGIQEEKHIQELLYMPEFEHLFGPAITFDLKALLVDHGGPNLRHGTAHGLRSADEFSTADTLYFWCLVLGFCIPIMLQAVTAEAAKKMTKDAKG